MLKTSACHPDCLLTSLILTGFLLADFSSFSQQLQIQSKVKFLALGDSYTIGQSVPAADSWPAQLIDSLKQRGLDCFDPQIIATTGWTTDDLKAAISNAGLKNEYNLVSLLIGVNNYYQGAPADSYGAKFQDLLTTAIALAKGKTSNVFVVSIPDYGYTPFGENNQSTISAGIDRYNLINDSVSKSNHVPYFNITGISRGGIAEPDLVASDGLHPSGKQYSMWVRLIMEGSAFNTDPSDTSGITTGINKDQQVVEVYPNPFHQELAIDGISPGDGISIHIFNQVGQLMILPPPEQSDTGIRFHTENLPAGFYVYHISGTRGTSAGKLIKY